MQRERGVPWDRLVSSAVAGLRLPRIQRTCMTGNAEQRPWQERR